MEVCQNTKSNLVGHGVLVQVLQCQIWSTNTKSFFLQDQAKLESLQKLTPFIGVSHKSVFKSVKSITRIFWATEYLFKALECQIWSTNTKSCFWKNEAKLQTLQKLSPYIGVSCKLLLRSVKSFNRIFVAM